MHRCRPFIDILRLSLFLRSVSHRWLLLLHLLFFDLFLQLLLLLLLLLHLILLCDRILLFFLLVLLFDVVFLEALHGWWNGGLALILTIVHAVDRDGAGARLIQVLHAHAIASAGKHLGGVVRFATVRIDLIGGAKTALTRRKSVGTDRRELIGAAVKIW